MKRTFNLFVLLALLLAGLTAQPVQAAQGDTTRVSVASDGTQGNEDSESASVSSDGRYAAFESNASNLVAGDTNGWNDIFVHDRQTGATTRVSVASDGTQGNHSSNNPSISADGRYVAFDSNADNLVAGDTNGMSDVFVRDTQTNATTRVSLASDGTQGNNDSGFPSISADGRYVAFQSYASNLVAGDTNGADDVFVRDTQTNTTTRVSVASSGLEGNIDSGYPSISADGRYVAFESYATNLVTGDTNGVPDIFMRDTQANVTTRVSVDSSGAEGDFESYSPSISADGRYVAFHSLASNLVSGDTNWMTDVFVRDTQANITTRVSLDSSGVQGNDSSFYPSISADGRYVAFESYADNLAAGDTDSYADIFVHDRQTATTARVSVDPSGVEGNGDSYDPSISGDGRYVAFESDADNLVAGDTNGSTDVFVNEFASTSILVAPPNGADTQTNRPAFDWNDVAGATQYQLQVALEPTFAKPALKKMLKATQTSYIPTKNLLPDATYYWRVRAKVGKTYTNWSEVWSFTTGNPPPIPVLTSPGNKKTVAGPSPLFDWKDVTGATFHHYEIEIAADADFVGLLGTGYPPISQYGSFILLPGTYYWRVRSVAGNGDFSAWSTVRIVKIT